MGPSVAVLIAIAIGTFSYLDNQADKNFIAAAEHSQTVISQTERLLAQLTDAEVSERGFLVTGDEHYLETYRAALPEIHQLLGDLSRPGLSFADAPDATNLLVLTREMLSVLASGVDVPRGKTDTSLVLQAANRARETMGRIRTMAARLVEAEHREFKAHSEAAQAHANRVRQMILLGAIALVLLLLTSTRYVERLFRAQDQLLQEVGNAREQESRSKAAFETTLRSIGDAVIATDSAGVVQFMNPVAETLTGWTAASAAGCKLPEVFRIVNESTRVLVENPVDIVLRDGMVVGLANHTILLSRDGREVPIDDSGAPIHDKWGATTGVVLVFRDVTQRRQARLELEESERRYRLLFEANPEAMWVFDTETLAFLMVNNAAIQRYGYTREEFLGMTLRDIRPTEDVALLDADIRKGDGRLHTDGPWRHRKKDGSIFFVDIAVHPIMLGARSGRLVMAKDITDRRRLEEQLRQSQKLEAVGLLAGGIAHDFNNLLTVIEGYAEMIIANQSPDNEHFGATQEILVASQRASALTHQLLAFSRRQVLQPRRINLNFNISQTQKMLNRLLGEDIHIVTRLDRNLRDISADSGQIDQIILNLAVNGRDAMERGGTLTIETSNVDFTEKDAAPYLDMAPGRYVRLSITDTGHGMDEETRRHIFEPFFTTKEPGRGTGLGLSTVYGIVKQSGGNISLQSEPGRGTTFTIYLPGVAVSQEAPQAPTPQPTAPVSETVLVVEDDETVRTLVTAMLTNLGYTVLKAETPGEALSLCGDPAVRIDLLLTDMVLPETDGLAVAQQATLHRPALKVLLMSGYTEHSVLRRQEQDTQTHFLQKPFTRAMLAKKIREILDNEFQNGAAAG